MAKEGIPFVALFLVPAAALAALGIWSGAIFFSLISAFMVFFFRDPERVPPSENGLIVSPADGRVIAVEMAEPGSAASPTQVSIFLSPLDVHINRSPIAGQITELVHKPGAFHIASRQIASAENEQNIVTVRGQQVTIVFRQIAGFLARRVVFWKRPGEWVQLGERVGLMKFGSRVDVLMPPGVEVLVKRGDRVKGGVSPIGRVRAPIRKRDG
jgi:phosphatidylserine decarboxylase